MRVLFVSWSVASKTRYNEKASSSSDNTLQPLQSSQLFSRSTRQHDDYSYVDHSRLCWYRVSQVRVCNSNVSPAEDNGWRISISSICMLNTTVAVAAAGANDEIYGQAPRLVSCSKQQRRRANTAPPPPPPPPPRLLLLLRAIDFRVAPWLSCSVFNSLPVHVFESLFCTGQEKYKCHNSRT